MRSSYLIYPDAIEKLENSIIKKRIDDLKKSEETFFYPRGCILTNEIIESFIDLKERGFYKDLPQDFSKKYIGTMEGILNNSKDFFWTIQKSGSTFIEPTDLEDLLLFTGDVASNVLKPDEMWNYSKFGFSSSLEFISAVGVFVLEQFRDRNFYERGYKWLTKRDDGSEILTEITGDHNADLRIYQKDITPYCTIDPFGNSSLIRPQTNNDFNCIAGYHSTEPEIFVNILKYIDQQNISVEFRKDNAKKIIDWGRSLGQRGGSCTEHLFGGHYMNPSFLFISYNLPMPKLNKNNETDLNTIFLVGTEGESAYGTYIANNGDLVFSRQSREDFKNPKKVIHSRFLPSDAEHLVKGLIYQSANGLGRTSVKQLLDILEYKYSPQFELDQKKYE